MFSINLSVSIVIYAIQPVHQSLKLKINLISTCTFKKTIRSGLATHVPNNLQTIHIGKNINEKVSARVLLSVNNVVKNSIWEKILQVICSRIVTISVRFHATFDLANKKFVIKSSFNITLIVAIIQFNVIETSFFLLK